VDQHLLAALHRLRSGWLSARTARINAVRGILRELGHFIPKGAQFVVPAVIELVEDADSDLPDALRSHLEEACSEIQELKRKCTDIEHQLLALSKQLPKVQRLLTIPGIGLLTATAIVGFIGDLRRFPSARRFASYLGVVPKENSSGDVRRLGRITKRGDSYIRMLLTHGGRAVLRAAHVVKNPPDKLRAWALKIHRSRGHNKAAIAVANKLARIAWAVSTRETTYQPLPAAA
jgi:transposase